MWTSTEAGLRQVLPSFERIDPVLLGLAESQVAAGDVIWDIGANVGMFALAAAGIAGSGGHVLAIEPDAWLIQLLRRSSARTPASIARVDVLGVAIGGSVGVARFAIAKRSRSSSYLDGYGGSQTGGTREFHLVPTVTLDWLLEHFAAPQVLKIDVEGAEADVLRGAANLLRDHRPRVICEVSHAADAVTTLLRENAYELFDGGYVGELRPTSGATYTTVAIPEGRSA